MTVATEQKTWGLWINGEYAGAESGDTFDVTNPATGETLATVAKAGTADLDKAVAAAQTALTGAWGKTPAAERSRLMHAFADAMQANFRELVALETANVGKAIQSVKGEVIAAINTIRFFASGTGSLHGDALPMGGSIMSYTRKEPVGVVGQIVPWNYPLMMASWKLGPALAAGCTVVMKPATATPLTAVKLAELATEAGIPEGVINVLPGPGSSLGGELVRHPGIAKIAFTGATETGQWIMREAAEGMKRLTLELGGKSPNIVFADADLDSAVPSSVWSIFYSGGQSCEARSRILVDKSIYDDFVAKFVAMTEQLVVGDPTDKATHIGSLISTAHRETVDGFVQRAVAAGGEIATGGTTVGDDGAFYAPTVITGATSDMEIFQEEVFGPVVTITPFDDEKDAIRIANDVKYGLMGTVWTGDAARGHRVAARIDSGMVGVNLPYTGFPGLPFGGYKQSGFGRELSLDSLSHYTEEKAITFNTGGRPINPWGLEG